MEGLDKGTEEEEGGCQPVQTPGPLLLALVGGPGLLPLDHAAPHDAVEAPQVEEGDGAEQAHGDDLSDQSRAALVTYNWFSSDRLCSPVPAGDLR